MRTRFCTVLAFFCAGLALAGKATAGTVTQTVDGLFYQAAPGETNDVVIKGSFFSGFRVIDSSAPVTAGAGCTALGPNRALCFTGQIPAFGKELVEVSVGDMNDTVRCPSDVDTIRIHGGDGADALKGGSAENILDGGPGPDVFRASPRVTATDVVDYSTRTEPVRATIGDGLPNDGEAGEGDLISDAMTDIEGGMGDDTITSVSEGDVFLSGNGGDDTLTLRAGWAVLIGGEGDDTLINKALESFVFLAGQGGNDVLEGGIKKDELRGAAGNDLLFGGGGADSLKAGAGNDFLAGGRGKDWMGGEEGRDVFYARDGTPDRLSGGAGRDWAQVDKGLDRVADIELHFSRR